ncbi:PAS domain-containing sensor histidine kinase [Cesiribacter sp. SM1]|uniref:PAS domain-containing sensor histidine kinase n=1 Tax=Cesiribacter sp. SM1 TaxID=2861196 RepID=UPI001CD7AA3B|nr:PAS domain-containing sensor histidine kinase [Cesiribacter sp. SM1]
MANWLESADAVVIFTGTTLLQCNKAAVRLFAYQHEQQLLAQTPASLLLSQPNSMSASECLLMLLSQSLQEGFIKNKVQCRRADNSTFYANLLVVPEKDPDGGHTYFCTKWLPVHAEVPAQEPQTIQLQHDAGAESLDLLRVNSVGEILQANKTLCSWLGYEPRELLNGIALQEILQNASKVAIQPGSREQTNTATVQPSISPGSNAVINLQAAFKEQEDVLRILLSAVPDKQALTNINRPALECLKQDNKHLKLTEEESGNRTDKYRVLAEYSPDIIMQFDRQHRHTFVNSQVQNYLPYQAEDFLGKTQAEMGFPESFTSVCHNALEQVFSSGQRLQLDLELPDSTWVDWVLIPEFNATGEVESVVTTARDITEQKRTTLELQKSQQKLKDAFEVTKLCSWEYSIADECLLLNQPLRDLLGIPEPLEALPGEQFCEKFLLPEELGKLSYLLRTAVEFSQSCFKEVVDYRIKRTDGTIIHVLSSIRLEISHTGEIVHAFGTAQDITQLRLTEQELEEYRTGLEQLVATRTEELRKSEEKLADALRLANLGTWEFDPVADCFLVSDTVLEIMGTSRAKEGGNMIAVSRMRESIYPDDREKYLKIVERTVNSDNDSFSDHLELRIRRGDGEVRHLYVSIKIAKTRNFIKYYGTLQDISSIRLTEHEKDRLTAIIEATSDIVSIAATDGTLLYLNKAGRDFFGIRKEEPLQQKSIFSFKTARFTKAISRRALKHADRYGTWSGQNSYLRYDGREIHVSQVVISHKDPEGHVQCYSTILRDMTAQKKIEQDLLFKNNELDTFIYRASHDLRGPIATMMGLNQIVKYEVDDPAALKYFELFNSQIVRLHNITVSLIELTKIKDRKCQVSKVDFKALWRSIKTNIAMLPESTEVVLQESIEAIKDFKSDAQLLETVLYNLVENSIRYRRSEVESFAHLEILASREPGWVTIKVADNGIGIDSKLQHKIYNMFFRGTDRSKGPGLGLYILKNAVEKLGGRISLLSIPYKGTTFKIELPSL